MKNLEGKTAVIIGATGDIGSSLVKELHKLGANIVAAGRNQYKVREFEILGTKVRPFEIKGIQNEAREMIAEAKSAFGRLDILITSVGKWEPVNVNSTPEKFASQLHTDLASFVEAVTVPMFTFNRYFEEHEGGLIVDISSHAAEGFLPGNLTYAPAKAAVKTFIENLSVENGISSKVTILRAISQLVDTPKNRLAHPEISEEQWATAVKVVDIAKWIAKSYEDPKNAEDEFFGSGVVL